MRTLPYLFLIAAASLSLATFFTSSTFAHTANPVMIKTPFAASQTAP